MKNTQTLIIHLTQQKTKKSISSTTGISTKRRKMIANSFAYLATV